jgi:hypothetical protein
VLRFKADLDLDPFAMDSLTNSPYGEVGRWLARKGQEMAAGARAQVGVRTGRLRASIAVSQERVPLGQELRIVADAVAPGRAGSYALDHHEGTPPHLIRAKGRGALVFPGGRGVAAAKVVHHPGTRANKFLSDQLPILFVP